MTMNLLKNLLSLICSSICAFIFSPVDSIRRTGKLSARVGLVSISLLCSVLSVPAYAGEAARVVFVSGKVEVAGKAATLNLAVQEGDDIATGADGYVYMTAIDKGLLILRPNSKAKIVSYHVEPATPANTRIKFELQQGVARSVSGQAAQQSRENFRFNTPVAAIGIRGTDFVVYTDQETTRVAVLSGGVVVSGFGKECTAGGNGPCENAGSLELFARQSGQLLQISRGQAKPQLVPNSTASPDALSPPRPDEPVGKSGSAAPVPATVAVTDLNLDPKKIDKLAVVIPAVIDNAPRQITWGRWQAVLDNPKELDVAKQLNTGAKLISLNTYFALFQAKGSEWQVPTTGSMGFSMKESEAYVLDEAKNALSAAKIENGRLQVDFAKSSFTTGFDLVSGTDRFKLQTQGDVGPDGRIYGIGQAVGTSNMDLRGTLTADKGGSAAYLFQSRLDNNRLATGATYWSKQ